MKSFRIPPAIWLTLVTLLGMILTLWIMGREPICKCGYIKLWHGVVVSAENSQHVSDWYTPSHIIHGFAFYFLLWLFARRLSVGWRLLIATLVEIAWEILENTDAVIERYREVTISLDYYGDSILNSTADVLAMMVGFWMAMRLPVWVVIVLTVIFEVVTMYYIRDGLALNIIMLLYPLASIADWQAGR